MTENEADTLSDLIALSRSCENQRIGFLPRDLGATRTSHHKVTLRRMALKGWIDRDFGPGWNEPKPDEVERGSCRYRINPTGLQALENHKFLRQRVAEISAAARARVKAKLEGRA